MAASKAKPRQKSSPSDIAVGYQPLTRTYTTWTTGRLRAAEIAADGGQIRQAANLCDWILADDRVAGTIQTRVQSLLGLDPTFEASGDKRRSKRAVRALEAEEDWWSSYPESELAHIVTWGIILGLAPARHHWLKADNSDRVLPTPEFWHPQHLRWEWVTRRWLVRVDDAAMVSAGLERELVPGDGEWVLHTPYGAGRPWSQGLWRGLAPWVLLKHLAMQDWSRHSERAANLVGWHTNPKEFGSNATQRSELAQEIFQRGQDSVIVMPPGFDLKLVEATANTSQLYRNQIEAANTAIAISIRGGNLTTEVQAGSRAAAESQERLGDDVKRRFDELSLMTTIHDQSLNWWAEFNFGDASLAPWPVYPTGPKRDLVSKANSLVGAATALERFVQLGLKIDQQGFIDEFELNGIVEPGPEPLQPAPTPVKPAQVSDPSLTG
jgi:hypothetical protein